MAALTYPKANRTAAWHGDDYEGAPIDSDTCVWHTTETGGRPSYGGDGRSAPHVTFDPDGLDWWQHYSLDVSARALRNEPGGVDTNTEDAIQIEIIAYSDETLARQRGHLPVSELSRDALEELAEFSVFARDKLGVPLRIDPGWVRSNYRNPTRMSYATWRGFAGHTGHNRIPEQSHWDPAGLDINTVMAIAHGGQIPPTPPLEEDDMPQYSVQRYGRKLWRLFTAGHPPIPISEWDYNTLKASGVPDWDDVHGGKPISNAAVEILARRIPGVEDTANAVNAFHAAADDVSIYTRVKRIDAKLDTVVAAQGKAASVAKVAEVDFAAERAAAADARATPVLEE